MSVFTTKARRARRGLGARKASGSGATTKVLVLTGTKEPSRIRDPFVPFVPFVVNHHRPPACSNACNVFRSNMAIVIRPTPPGTGVMAPATSDTGPYATSPTIR